MDFIDYKIDACSRLCNINTHLLAGYGSRDMIDNQHIWLTDLPRDVSGVVAGNIDGPTS